MAILKRARAQSGAGKKAIISSLCRRGEVIAEKAVSDVLAWGGDR